MLVIRRVNNVKIKIIKNKKIINEFNLDNNESYFEVKDGMIKMYTELNKGYHELLLRKKDFDTIEIMS